MKKLFFLSACSLFCICTACAWEAEAARPACTNPCSTSMVPRTGTGTKVYPGTETPITDKKEKKSNIKDMEAKDTVSYLVGFSLGSNLEGIPYKFDVESFLKGVQVALEGKDCGYPMSEVQRILTQWQQDIKKQESEKSMENKVKQAAPPIARRWVKTLPTVSHNVWKVSATRLPNARPKKARTTFRSTAFGPINTKSNDLGFHNEKME